MIISTSTAKTDRLRYMRDSAVAHTGEFHVIRREHVFEDVINLYTSSSVVEEFPCRIQFKGERATDAGGVTRDMFSAFWERSYQHMFDGGSLLIPAVHHQVDMSKFPILGTILSHGYMACGMLSVRIAFPVLAFCLFGPTVKITDGIIIESFVDHLVSYEGGILKQAFDVAGSETQFEAFLLTKLTNLLSRFGCRELPTPANLRRVITEVARHEFTAKAMGAIYAIHSGVPQQHKPFWMTYSIEQFYSIYKSLNATPSRVIEMLLEPLK